MLENRSMSINRKLLIVIVSVGLMTTTTGCEKWFKRTTTQPVQASHPRRIILPAGIAQTISAYANLVGGTDLPVMGYGVVGRLGNSGSSEVPTHLRKVLIRQMSKHMVGTHRYGGWKVSPERILEDKDTAVVFVSGRIPPAAPVGTRFDVTVEALPRTQTTSLDGGILMSTELYLSMTSSKGTLIRTRDWAVARGEIFVNPFIDRSKLNELVKLRVGRIPNGGLVTRPRPIKLELRRADYRTASLIQRRINQRFGSLGEKVANAKTPAIIDLHIPSSYRNDYTHFLELLLHLYVPADAAGQERYARQMARAILLPTARYEDISLAWEAMGKQVLPIIRPLYVSENQAAAYYAARAGLRMGDELAVPAIIRIAQRKNSPYQIPAINELGKVRKFPEVALPLKRMLLTSNNELVKIACYEALLKHGSNIIQRKDISRHFFLDTVDSTGDYIIYATVTGQPKIVLFGRKMPLNQPLFYSPEDEIVTINSYRDDKRVMVYRKIPGKDMYSDTLYFEPTVEQLISILGNRPEMDEEGNIKGLGLTYCQIVRVLHGLCTSQQIPAKFVLQKSPALRRTYISVPAAGRSDMPEGG